MRLNVCRSVSVKCIWEIPAHKDWTNYWAADHICRDLWRNCLGFRFYALKGGRDVQIEMV